VLSSKKSDDVALIAQQMTLYDFDLFQNIKTSELFGQAWNKESRRFNSPNVLAVINRFNEVAAWVASLILWRGILFTDNPAGDRIFSFIFVCVSEETQAERSREMKKVPLSCRLIPRRHTFISGGTQVILLMQELRKLNNYNSVAAICAGLNSSAIHRLKHCKTSLKKMFLFAPLPPTLPSSHAQAHSRGMKVQRYAKRHGGIGLPRWFLQGKLFLFLFFSLPLSVVALM
jgi:hypothetical protein